MARESDFCSRKSINGRHTECVRCRVLAAIAKRPSTSLALLLATGRAQLSELAEASKQRRVALALSSPINRQYINNVDNDGSISTI